jgi:hypothetical protein
MSRNVLPLAAAVCFGFGVGLVAGGFLDPSWAPRLGQCAPGSRGNVCIVDAEPLGAVVQAPAAPIALCGDGTLSYAAALAGACTGHGAVVIVLNDPALPADAPSCPVDVGGTGGTVTARGPICLNATPTP